MKKYEDIDKFVNNTSVYNTQIIFYNLILYTYNNKPERYDNLLDYILSYQIYKNNRRNQKKYIKMS